MLDHLDLEQTARNAQTARRRPWRGIVISVLFLALVGLCFFSPQLFFFFSPQSINPVGGAVTGRLQSWRPGGGWQTIQELPFNSTRIQAASANNLWIAGDQKIAHFDGATWKMFDTRDFGAQVGLVNQLVPSGQDVWATSSATVLHFDGSQWMGFPNVIPGQTVVALAAIGSSAWVLDDSGNLAHYNGQQWELSKLSVTLPLKVSKASYTEATLTATADGALWMTLEGLWQFDHNQWEPVGRDVFSAAATIIAISNNRVWLDDSGDLGWITTDKTASGQFSAQTMGLADDEIVSAVAMQDNRIWVVTDRGIVSYDGNQWQRVSNEAGSGQVFPVNTAIAPDGTVWKISMNLPDVYGYSPITYLLPSLLPIAGLVVLTILFFILMSRGRGRGGQQVNVPEMILRILPDLPERNVVGPNSQTFYACMIAAVIIINPFFGWLIPTIFPMFPGIADTFVTTLILIALLTGGKRLYDRASHPGAAFARPFKIEMAISLAIAVLMALIIGVYQTLQMIFDGSPVAVVVVVILLMAVILVTPLLIIKFGRRRFYAIRAALDDANYEKTLAFIERYRRTEPNRAIWPFMQGTTLLFAGRYEEANSLLREALAVGLHSAPVSILVPALNNLGIVLSAEKRYEEALRIFEVVVKINPAMESPYVALANAYLRQGINAERALQLLEQARTIKLRNMKIDRQIWATILAGQAWALTLLNEGDQVESLLQQALRETDQKFKPGLASLNYQVGQVLALRGEKARAAEHYKRVSEIDPLGGPSREAAEALQNL